MRHCQKSLRCPNSLKNHGKQIVISDIEECLELAQWDVSLVGKDRKGEKFTLINTKSGQHPFPVTECIAGYACQGARPSFPVCRMSSDRREDQQERSSRSRLRLNWRLRAGSETSRISVTR
jgi:hypothetical protein